MPFSNVIGQERIIKLIKNSLKDGRIAHAYLFVGPDGIGKTMVAKTLAQALNCPRADSDACGRCPDCRRIEKLSHPDVNWVRPAGLSRQIGIDDIRGLRRQISLKPYQSRKKVYLIMEADRMTAQASNALLKTLEEPPADSILILISSHPSSLFPTIVSRCQMMRFSPLSPKRIEDYLVKKLNLSTNKARLLSLLSEGRLGKALSLQEKAVWEGREKILNLGSQISHRDDLEKLLQVAEKMLELTSNFREKLEERLKDELREVEGVFSKEQIGEIKKEKMAFLSGETRRKVGEILDIIIGYYRDLLVFKEGGEIINLDRKEEIEKRAVSVSSQAVSKIIKSIEETKGFIERNVNLRLSLEAMTMKIAEELEYARGSSS
ncbi:DNA polymerase III subunit delta' [bacterium]|nr:DNA polymerase III subunit delta' [bacterium]